MVKPEQPWLDGFLHEKGLIRQFVALPLGSGYSAEGQLTGRAEQCGLQIVAFPYEERGVRNSGERRTNAIGRAALESLLSSLGQLDGVAITGDDPPTVPRDKCRRGRLWTERRLRILDSRF